MSATLETAMGPLRGTPDPGLDGAPCCKVHPDLPGEYRAPFGGGWLCQVCHDRDMEADDG